MKKKLIIIAILLMSIGFALISTNLIINGTSTIGKTTFDVYFSGAEVDGYDKTNEVVKDKKNIVFTSKDLLFTDDTSELVYEVTNNSSNYNAKVNVSCTNPSNKITVEEVPKSLTVRAKQIETGSIVVTLNEMAVDPEDVVITCTLNVNAEERTSLATDEIVVGTYGITGTLVDNNNNPIRDQYLAIYSEEKKIVQTDSNGFFYVSGLERGIHEIYLINESDIDSSDTEIKKKPKGITSTNKNETIIFTNNYKIKNTNIDTTTVMYQIAFDTLDEDIPNQTKYISKGSTYGPLPILEKEHYTFGGWYTSSTLQDESTKVSSTDTYNIEVNQTLYAKFDKWDLLSDVVNLGDFVAYDAGYWSSSEPIPTTYNSFGGYQINTNRANSVSTCSSSSGSTTLKGWKVLKIDKNTNTVTLIHAGQPECAKAINLNYTTTATCYTFGESLESRSTIYLNSEYAESTRSITAESNDKNALNSSNTLVTGARYFTSSGDGSCGWWSYAVDGSYVGAAYDIVLGYRPVVKLKSCLRTPGKGKDFVGQDNAWLLDNSEC